MAATWNVTLVLVALIYFLPNCMHMPAVNSEPLVITIAKDGINEEACLSGKIPCRNFQYVSYYFKGNNSDITLVITYPQEVSGAWYYYFNVSSLKFIGQGGDFTFICHNSDSYLYIKYNIYGFPKRVSFENIRMYCVPPLTIAGIRDVELKGYVGQGIVTGATTLSIENSTLSNIFGDSALISFAWSGLQNMTIKDSAVIHNDEKGRPLSILIDYSSRNFERVEILIENTNFTLTRAPPRDQSPITQLDFENHLENTSVNFTISNCQFFNYTSTAVLVNINKVAIIKDVYLNILDSTFTVPDLLNLPGKGIEVAQEWSGRANICTRLEGNRVVEAID